VIFEKKYLVFPINEHLHWYLLPYNQALLAMDEGELPVEQEESDTEAGGEMDTTS
jgi:hypothetical protein